MTYQLNELSNNKKYCNYIREDEILSYIRLKVSEQVNKIIENKIIDIENKNLSKNISKNKIIKTNNTNSILEIKDNNEKLNNIDMIYNNLEKEYNDQVNNDKNNVLENNKITNNIDNIDDENKITNNIEIINIIKEVEQTNILTSLNKTKNIIKEDDQTTILTNSNKTKNIELKSLIKKISYSDILIGKNKLNESSEYDDVHNETIKTDKIIDTTETKKVESEIIEKVESEKIEKVESEKIEKVESNDDEIVINSKDGEKVNNENTKEKNYPIKEDTIELIKKNSCILKETLVSIGDNLLKNKSVNEYNYNWISEKIVEELFKQGINNIDDWFYGKKISNSSSKEDFKKRNLRYYKHSNIGLGFVEAQKEIIKKYNGKYKLLDLSNIDISYKFRIMFGGREVPMKDEFTNLWHNHNKDNYKKEQTL